MALRNAAVVAATRLAPGLVLRGFDGIADRRPPAEAEAAPDSSPRQPS
ncbi:hypothetical protein ACFZCY_38010 [Streptomyces sp. NPDC007983]